MKEEYPTRFKKGELKEFKETLSSKNKSVLEEFIKHCSVTTSKGKSDKIERCILQFIYVVEKNLDEINKLDVDTFLLLLNKKAERKKWTKNEIKIYLKKFLLWKHKDFDLVSNIKLETKCFNESKINEGNLITTEEAERLVRVTEKLRDKCYIMLQFETGARPQELQILKWKNIKFEDNHALVNIYAPKTGQSRTFPVKDSMIHLKRWKQEYCYPNVNDNDFIFPSPQDRKRPVQIASFNWLIKQISKKAGINRDVFPYLFRHTRATKLYEELPQQIVEKLMGHKNMAGIYAHISSRKATEEMLKKIYHVEELTPEQKNKYEKEIEELKIHKKDMETRMKVLEKAYEEMFNYNVEQEDISTSKKLLHAFDKKN